MLDSMNCQLGAHAPKKILAGSRYRFLSGKFEGAFLMDLNDDELLLGIPDQHSGFTGPGYGD
jgi:hypothetical protein